MARVRVVNAGGRASVKRLLASITLRRMVAPQLEFERRKCVTIRRLLTDLSY